MVKIRFEEIQKGKLIVFTLKETLGEIKYYTKWRKYCFYPLSKTYFDDECLLQIIRKLQFLNGVVLTK